MYAVIATGGKQYKVKVDDYVDVELLDGEVGKEVVFDKGLAIGAEQGNLEGGAPVGAGATVKGELVDIFRGQKIVVFKMKRRKSYRRTRGHRQNYMRIKITGIAKA